MNVNQYERNDDDNSSDTTNASMEIVVPVGIVRSKQTHAKSHEVQSTPGVYALRPTVGSG